jgi:hypothetical protein
VSSLWQSSVYCAVQAPALQVHSEIQSRLVVADGIGTDRLSQTHDFVLIVVHPFGFKNYEIALIRI